MLNKPREPLPLAATLKPGNFAIGSAESRAAARGMLERKCAAESLPVMTVTVEHIGSDEAPEVINVYRSRVSSISETRFTTLK